MALCRGSCLLSSWLTWSHTGIIYYAMHGWSCHASSKSEALSTYMNAARHNQCHNRHLVESEKPLRTPVQRSIILGLYIEETSDNTESLHLEVMLEHVRAASQWSTASMFYVLLLVSAVQNCANHSGNFNKWKPRMQQQQPILQERVFNVGRSEAIKGQYNVISIQEET